MTITPQERQSWRKSSYSNANGDCVEISWRKSSYSGANGECVEVSWRKSRHSGVNGECVEVAFAAEQVGVRDSKNSGGPTLSFSPTVWRAFARSMS